MPMDDVEDSGWCGISKPVHFRDQNHKEAVKEALGSIRNERWDNDESLMPADRTGVGVGGIRGEGGTSGGPRGEAWQAGPSEEASCG